MIRTYKDIEYNLKRSRRRTASIYIERDGGVSILAPEDLSDERIEDLVERKRYWIYRGLAEWRDLNATRIEREFVNGEGFLYMGRSYRLKLVSDQNEPLLLKGGYFCLHTAANGRASEDAHAVFKNFYRAKGVRKIAERVRWYQPKLGVEAQEIRVMELRNRWASCSERGNVNFHWKCMMAPLTIIDYIVVHELAHLLHRNHTESFWNQVDKVLPDYRERREWLRVYGAGMGV